MGRAEPREAHGRHRQGNPIPNPDPNPNPNPDPNPNPNPNPNSNPNPNPNPHPNPNQVWQMGGGGTGQPWSPQSLVANLKNQSPIHLLMMFNMLSGLLF